MNFFTAIAHAVTINPNLPGMPASGSAGANPAGYINGFYSFALIVSGILAFGAIVYGGIRYAVGKGNPSSETEGKAWITSALLGLLLLAGAYLILYTVNPQIVGLNIQGLTPIAAPSGAYGAGTGQGACGSLTCPAGSSPVNTQTDPNGTAQCSCQNSSGKVSCGGQDNGSCPNDASGNPQSCVQTQASPVVWGCKSNAVVNDCGVPPNHPGNCANTRYSCTRTDNNPNATSGSAIYGCR